MALTFSIKNGNVANLPATLVNGKPALTVDEGGLYYGINNLPVKVADKSLCNESVVTNHNHSSIKDASYQLMEVKSTNEVTFCSTIKEVLKMNDSDILLLNNQQRVSVSGKHYYLVNNSYSPKSNDYLVCDSSLNDITLTFPESNIAGNLITVFNSVDSEYNVTVNFNSNKFEGTTDTYSVIYNNIVTFIYVNSIIGWKIINTNVNAPEVTYPTASEEDIDVFFTIISDSSNTVDIHEETQYQIQVANGNWSTLALDVTITSPVTSYEITDSLLDYGINYEIRCRYKYKYSGYSKWSEGILFTTMEATINTPTITYPTASLTNVSPTCTLTSSAFSGTDTHTGTQYQIQVTGGNWTSTVLDTGTLGAVTSYTITSGVLSNGTTYNVRVRYQGQSIGWSEWSTAITFTTYTLMTWATWNEVSELNLATSSIFVCKMENTATGGGEVGLGGPSGSVTLTPFGSIPGVVNGGTSSSYRTFTTGGTNNPVMGLSIPATYWTAMLGGSTWTLIYKIKFNSLTGQVYIAVDRNCQLSGGASNHGIFCTFASISTGVGITVFGNNYSDVFGLNSGGSGVNIGVWMYAAFWSTGTQIHAAYSYSRPRLVSDFSAHNYTSWTPGISFYTSQNMIAPEPVIASSVDLSYIVMSKLNLFA